MASSWPVRRACSWPSWPRPDRGARGGAEPGGVVLVAAPELRLRLKSRALGAGRAEPEGVVRGDGAWVEASARLVVLLRWGGAGGGSTGMLPLLPVRPVVGAAELTSKSSSCQCPALPPSPCRRSPSRPRRVSSRRWRCWRWRWRKRSPRR